MLINSTRLIETQKVQRAEKTEDAAQALVLETKEQITSFIDDKDQILTKTIKTLIQGNAIHYFSYGNFNLVRLIVHLIKQTGPVHIFMTSYSFSQKSIEQLIHQQTIGNILSFKVLVDNRVKTMSPKPFQMLKTVFDYRCSSIHAKIALLWNDNWKLSVVTSQNATDNPKMERGTIFSNPDVFEFDHNALTNEYNRGTA